jgi:hypothetical protein
VELLLQDLLVITAWKAKVFPHLADRISPNSSMRAYFVLYHEASVVNLLEILFYSKAALFAAGDLLLDLVDYCHRKMCYLNGYTHPAEEVVDPSKRAADVLAEQDDIKVGRGRVCVVGVS